jgi:hypothetical protein
MLTWLSVLYFGKLSQSRAWEERCGDWDERFACRAGDLVFPAVERCAREPRPRPPGPTDVFVLPPAPQRPAPTLWCVAVLPFGGGAAAAVVRDAAARSLVRLGRLTALRLRDSAP